MAAADAAAELQAPPQGRRPAGARRPARARPLRVHLDTDFAGDTDDACALALLLGWPDVDVVAVTTTADPGGERAAYVRRFLDLAGRPDIPVAAGGRAMGGLPDHDRYWGGDPVAPVAPASGEAASLLATSIDAGATVVAIGPLTNLAELEARSPGALARPPVVVMGGWVKPPAQGLPQWGPEMDWNVQCDTQAAVAVVEAAREPTMVTLAATLAAPLLPSHLPRLEAAGPVGRLLARQARAHAADFSMPEGVLNYQYDAVACGVAVGWPGARAETMRLLPVFDGDTLRFAPADEGHEVRVVTEVDGHAFAAVWLDAVERVDAGSLRG